MLEEAAARHLGFIQRLTGRPFLSAGWFTMAGVKEPNRRIVDTAAILVELEAQRDRLNDAIDALQGSMRRRGRGRISANPTNGKKRHLSAAARRRISEAMKKRWAARKKAAGAD